jgi:hypothetical protein
MSGSLIENHFDLDIRTPPRTLHMQESLARGYDRNALFSKRRFSEPVAEKSQDLPGES